MKKVLFLVCGVLVVVVVLFFVNRPSSAQIKMGEITKMCQDQVTKPVK